MARKSRKEYQSVQIVQTMQAARVPTAIYARLSVENSGKEQTKDVIKNQIEICKNYLQEQPQLNLIDTYIDNGHSGTKFDRPEFNRLMRDIRSGQIQCLVVRDLSRFGRDYIETGTYLERIFPKLGLRFISIKERYDTSETDLSNEALMIPLQNMINGLYSKDISRKVSTALSAQIEEGTYKNRNLAYGYMWNEDGTEVVIDEDVAVYVRMVYAWKLCGVPTTQIVRNLEELKAPTCDKHKYIKGFKTGNKPKGGRWGQSSLMGILTNRVYVGDTVHGKSVSAIYKGEKQRLEKDRSKWIIYEDTHPAIISREDFARVQQIFEETQRERDRKIKESEKIRLQYVDLFPHKIFCADCGKRMYMRVKKQSRSDKWYGCYICGTYARKLTPKCASHMIQLPILEEKILSAIRLQVSIALDYEKVIEKLAENERENQTKEKLNNAISSLNLKLNGIQKKRLRLYEDFRDGILTEEEYLYVKTNFDIEFQNMNTQLEELVKKRTQYGEILSLQNPWLQLMKSVPTASKLTQAMVDEVIERVEVHLGGKLEIYMKYQDIYHLTTQYIQRVQGDKDEQ